MKASKLINKKDRNFLFGQYTKIKKIYNQKLTFEQFLTTSFITLKTQTK